MKYKIYRNKESLKGQNPELFELVNNHLILNADDKIYIYTSPEDYAKYLIQKGYCDECFLDKKLSDFVDYTKLRIYIIQLINYKKLGEYIIKHMNKEKIYYNKETNIVISITK